LEEVTRQQAVFGEAIPYLGELLGVVTVVHDHRVAGSDEPKVLEAIEPAQSSSSSPMPVDTSAEHIGQVTVGTRPTMKVKPHSGHSILGIGCSGGVLAFANAAPYACVTIWEAHRTREPEAAMDWQKRILRAAQLVTVKYGVPGLKYAMDLNGYYGGPPRLPLAPITPEAKKEIEQSFDGLKG